MHQFSKLLGCLEGGGPNTICNTLMGFAARTIHVSQVIGTRHKWSLYAHNSQTIRTSRCAGNHDTTQCAVQTLHTSRALLQQCMALQAQQCGRASHQYTRGHCTTCVRTVRKHFDFVTSMLSLQAPKMISNNTCTTTVTAT